MATETRNESARAGDRIGGPRTATPSAAGPATSTRDRAAEGTTGTGSPAAAIPREAIAKRAYAIDLARGGGHGADVDDGLQAEAELRPGRGRR